ncbi:MAG: hypothetical protein PHE53_09400 [Thermoguttaceae bacterium]|nr:hypothetical protein [Thermoguttaceae bacterium]
MPFVLSLSSSVMLAQTTSYNGSTAFPAPGTPGGAVVPSTVIPNATSASGTPYTLPSGYDSPVSSSGTVSGYGTSEAPIYTPTLPADGTRGGANGVNGAADASGTGTTAVPSGTGTVSSLIPSANDAPIPGVAGAGEATSSRSGLGGLSSFFGSAATTPIAVKPSKAAFRRFQISGRHENSPQISIEIDENTGQRIAVITGGVNIVVEGLQNEAMNSVIQGDVLDLSAENIVIWTQADFQSPTGANIQSADQPMEIYLSGNIEYRQGEYYITADRMYLDVQKQIGAILNAELIAPIPDHDVLMRLHSELLRMTGPGSFSAGTSYLTTSQIGLPRYRVQVSSADLQMAKTPRYDNFGTPILGADGNPLYDETRFAETRGNAIYLDRVPVFWWPKLSTNLDRNDYYLTHARFRNDKIFGFQAITDWDVYQLLGLSDPPAGLEWNLSLDYLTKRGFGHGTDLHYGNVNADPSGPLAGTMNGFIDYWGIYDSGYDNISKYRSHMEPPHKYRYRVFGQHRQTLEAADWLGGDVQFSGELGWAADRNFMLQYYPDEWDERKNESTDLEIKRMIDNRSMALRGQVRLNDFVTETQWYPKFDHYWIGQDLGQALTWSEHTSLGYADFKTLSQPDTQQNPDDAFRYLPWEIDSNGNPLHAKGGRFVTRHELAWPIQLGAFKFTPYVLGEAGYWMKDVSDESISRLYGQAGFRSSLPFTGVNSELQSDFWNLNGLAHKATLEVNGFYADANKDVSEFPMYDNLDDWSMDAFRRRMYPYIYPTIPSSLAPDPAIPWKYDIRSYALRGGMQNWVSAPSMEMADDLFMFQVALNQRFQTKRGGISRQRIVDWFRFDSRLSIYPKKDRDDFGKLFGLFDYDSRWQVGDRLAFTSVGMFDFFTDPLQFATFGSEWNRVNGDSAYLGVHWLGGPGVPQTTLIGSYNYRMTDCWRSEFTMTMNLEKAKDINQSFDLVRVGESFEVLAGFNYNYATEVWGMHFGVTPVALAKALGTSSQTTTLDTLGRHGTF